MAIERAISGLTQPIKSQSQSSPEQEQDASPILPLLGYEIMIVNGSDQTDKSEFEQKAIQLGAKIVQSPPSGLSRERRFFAIAGKDCGIRVKNLKAMGTVDLVDCKWLVECLERGSFVPFKPR